MAGAHKVRLGWSKIYQVGVAPAKDENVPGAESGDLVEIQHYKFLRVIGLTYVEWWKTLI